MVPLCVEICFHLPYPKLPKRKLSALWEKQPVSKPDVDNLVKFYLDAANQILWHDDRQITSIIAHKIYSQKPKTVIKVNRKIIGILDAKTKSILDLFSPEMFDELLQDVRTFEAYEKQQGIFFEEGALERRALLAAELVSKWAEKWGDVLAKINKSHPGYWKDIKLKEGSHD
jgi:hypothetical protein